MNFATALEHDVVIEIRPHTAAEGVARVSEGWVVVVGLEDWMGGSCRAGARYRHLRKRDVGTLSPYRPAAAVQAVEEHAEEHRAERQQVADGSHTVHLRSCLIQAFISKMRVQGGR